MLNYALSNPDMLKKIMDVMPLVTGMMNTAAPKSAPEPVPAPVQTPVPPPVPVSSGSANQSSIPDSDQIAAMINTLMKSFSQNQQISANFTEQAAVPPEIRQEEPAVPAAAPETAQPAQNAQTQTPPQSSDTGAGGAGGFDIEKALGMFRKATEETSPENDHRVAFLLALRPLLKDGRQQKIDMAVKYLNAAKIFKLLGKNGFNL